MKDDLPSAGGAGPKPQPGLGEVVALHCFCSACGKTVYYLPGQGGTVVQCPQCHSPTQLPAAPKTKPGPGLMKPGVLPFTQKKCPDCGGAVNSDSSCPACLTKQQQNRKYIVLAGALIVVLIAGVVFAVMRTHKIARAKETAAAAAASNSGPGHIFILTAPANDPSRATNDLWPRHFVLERRRGSDFAVAVGDVENLSQRIRYGLKVDIELLDRNGHKIGTVNDTITHLAPNAVWHVIASTSDTNAINARFAGIKENQ